MVSNCGHFYECVDHYFLKLGRVVFFVLLKFAIQEFYQEKRYQNVAPGTLQNYKYALEDLRVYCEEREITNINEITTRTIKGFFLTLQEKGNNPVTLNSKTRLLKGFFNWLIDEGFIDDNPAKGLKKVREDIRIQTFTDEQVQQILSYFRKKKRKEDTFFAVRNYTVFLTLIGTGVRVGELINIKWNDVDFRSGVIKVFGKSRTEATVPLSNKLSKELAEYKVWKENYFNESSEYVFVNQHNKPITVNAIKCMFKRLATVMDFKGTRVSAHSARHYYAKRYIQSGGDIVSLARILRHTSVKTTERYLHYFGNELKDQNEKHNPLNDMEI